MRIMVLIHLRLEVMADGQAHKFDISDAVVTQLCLLQEK